MLRNSDLTDEGIVQLRPLRHQLKSLRLDGNKITDKSLPVIGEFKKLESLSLSSTDITDAGLVHLESLTNLEWLDLSNWNLTREGMRYFLTHPTLSLSHLLEWKDLEQEAEETMREFRKLEENNGT